MNKYIAFILLFVLLCSSLACYDTEATEFAGNIKYLITDGNDTYLTDDYVIEDGFVVIKDYLYGGCVSHKVVRIGQAKVTIRDY
jgi:hypothetical protein